MERGIGVMLHSILEVLPNFVGHSVAERNAIEARQTFAERLFKKDSVVELDVSPEELDAHIQNWLTGTYHQRAHGGTGQTPFAMATAWTGKVRHLDNERALDVLLMPTAANGGTRTLQKRGIEIERGWYAAPELFRKVEVGTEVLIRDRGFRPGGGVPGRRVCGRGDLPGTQGSIPQGACRPLPQRPGQAHQGQ